MLTKRALSEGYDAFRRVYLGQNTKQKAWSTGTRHKDHFVIYKRSYDFNTDFAIMIF